MEEVAVGRQRGKTLFLFIVCVCAFLDAHLPLAALTNRQRVAQPATSLWVVVCEQHEPGAGTRSCSCVLQLLCPHATITSTYILGEGRAEQAEQAS